MREGDSGGDTTPRVDARMFRSRGENSARKLGDNKIVRAGSLNIDE